MYSRYLLSNEDKNILLYEMKHVASAGFYSSLQEQWKKDYADGYEIHIEGFKQDTPWGKKYINSMREFAQWLGLENQKRPEVPHLIADMSYDELGLIDKAKMNSFSAAAAILTRQITTHGNDELKQKARDLLGDDDVTEETDVKLPFESLLLGRRNERAVSHALTSPKNVAMIWGKRHSAGIRELLANNGYHVVSQMNMNS